MQLFEKINNKLKNVPNIKILEKKHYLAVIPTSAEGFKVSIYADGKEFAVSYADGWHEDFLNEEHALHYFFFGLSDKCRLKVSQRGEYSYKWRLEYFEEGKWEFESEVRLLLFPFWRKEEIQILQNKVL